MVGYSILLLIVTGIICISGTVFADNLTTGDEGSVQQAPVIEWFKTYGQAADDDALAAIRTAGGSFIVGGATESSDQTIDNAWIKQISPEGDTEWTQNYDLTILDEARSICTTPSGNYVMAGCVEPAGEDGPDNLAVIMVDSKGNLIWNMTYGDNDEEARCVIPKEDNGVLVVGITSIEEEGSDEEGSDALILSISPAGTIEWINKIGEEEAVDAQSVVGVTDGYVLAGYKEVEPGNYDAWICKTDLLGNVLWEKTYGGTLIDSAHEILQDEDGFVVTGEKASGSAGGSDLWIFKISDNGDIIWDELQGGPLDDKGYSISRTKDSGYLVAGTTQSYGAGMTDAWIVKFANDGTPQWSKTIGGPKDDLGSYAMEIEGNDIITCGMTDSYGAGMFDAMVAELGW